MFIRSLMGSTFLCRAPEGASTGTGADPEPQTFSLEYVRELRAEAKKWRLNASDLEGKLTAAEKARDTAVAVATADADAKVAAATKAANDRMLGSELRAAAKTAGMVDLDGLKLLDTSGVKLKEDGTLDMPSDFFAKAREAKAYLFTTPSGADTGTTSSQAKAPPANTSVAGKHARDLSASDFDAELRRLTAA